MSKEAPPRWGTPRSRRYPGRHALKHPIFPPEKQTVTPGGFAAVPLGAQRWGRYPRSLVSGLIAVLGPGVCHRVPVRQWQLSDWSGSLDGDVSVTALGRDRSATQQRSVYGYSVKR